MDYPRDLIPEGASVTQVPAPSHFPRLTRTLMLMSAVHFVVVIGDSADYLWLPFVGGQVNYIRTDATANRSLGIRAPELMLFGHQLFLVTGVVRPRWW
jgi:hypothetical protein